MTVASSGFVSFSRKPFELATTGCRFDHLECGHLCLDRAFSFSGDGFSNFGSSALLGVLFAQSFKLGQVGVVLGDNSRLWLFYVVGR